MPYIIAVDYDGTLFEGDYPKIGNPIIEVIEKTKEFQQNGAELVLWTCREGLYLHEAIVRCREVGLEFDAINDNTASQMKFMQHKLKTEGNVFCHRKIFADIYVDDRSPGSIDYFLKMVVKFTCDKFRDR
jgi:hypothetical protein